jgi:hypothetical protein
MSQRTEVSARAEMQKIEAMTAPAPCRSPAVTGRRRCRMHGGAQGSGGPKGARNDNYKHGRYTADTIATRRWLRERIREVRTLTKGLRQL